MPSHLDVLDVLRHPLTSDEAGELERMLLKDAFKGSRYGAAQMAMLDSEK